MSKAFTRESDDLPEQPIQPRPLSSLPPGARNYLTPGGADKLRAELARLIEVERPEAAKAAAADPATSRVVALLDQRIQHLQHSLHTAVIVPPPDATEDRVRFGASVTVRQQDGVETCYRIVGVDETDLDRDWVSWLSPIARALINARVGQRVRFKFPSGEHELEILRITYE